MRQPAVINGKKTNLQPVAISCYYFVSRMRNHFLDLRMFETKSSVAPFQGSKWFENGASYVASACLNSWRVFVGMSVQAVGSSSRALAFFNI